MRTAIAAIATLGITSLALAGCATSLGSRAQETNSLKQQVASLEGQVSTLAQQMEEMSQRQATMEAQVQGQSAGAAQTARPKTASLSNRQIQVALKTAGFYQGPVDGKIGPQTREAVRAFQRSRGLTPDGKVGIKTAAALARELPSESAAAGQ